MLANEDWRTSRMSSNVKVTGQGHLSEGSRSLGNVVIYSVAGSEILLPMDLFPSYHHHHHRHKVNLYIVIVS